MPLLIRVCDISPEHTNMCTFCHSLLLNIILSTKRTGMWITTSCVAAWRSGNVVGRINEVTLRRARLVLGWVTCPSSTPGGGTLFRYVTSHPGRLSLSSFRGR